MEMQNAATIMSDHKEAIENTEGHGWDGGEIHGGDRFVMVVQERFPLSASMRFLRNTWHPARDGPLGNVKAKLQQLTLNVRRTPCGVLRHHSNIRIISSRISLLTGFRPAARWRETLAGNADHLQYASADVGR